MVNDEMKDSTRRNVKQQLRINNSIYRVPEAHLRASAFKEAYGSWNKLFNKHTDIIATDIQKIYPSNVKVVIDNDLDKDND